MTTQNSRSSPIASFPYDQRETLLARVVVVGTSGSGKTTLASRLAEILSVPHIELDALHWEAHWQEG